MSRGLGTLQRKIIETSGCHCSVFDLGRRIEFTVAHDKPKSALGVTVEHKPETHWRVDKAPWYEATTLISTFEELCSLRAEFRFVGFKRQKSVELFTGAVWNMESIREQLYPGIWGDQRESALNSRGYYVPMTPPDIKRQRNTAKAGMSRAMGNFIKRGWMDYVGYDNGNCYAFLVNPQHVGQDYYKAATGSPQTHAEQKTD